MAKAKSPAAALAERLLDILKTQRELGPDSYPLTVRDLAMQAEVQPDSEIVQQAVANRLFKAEAVVALKGNLRSPVALKEDAAQLVESSVLLEQLLELTCTEAAPAVTLAALQKHLGTNLKQPFKAATERRLQEKQLPEKVGSAGTNAKPLLFLTRMPPPPPPPPPLPKKKSEVQLAENLVRVLEAQRDLGESAYPLMLQRLVALTDTEAAKSVVKKALGQAPFKDQVVLGAKLGGKVTDCPVALATDRETLASSPILLEFLLRPQLKPQARTATVANVVKKATTDLGPLVKQSLDHHLEANTLPLSLGWMWIKDAQHLFFLEDVHPAGRAAPPERPVVPAPPPLDFARAFEDAFQRLDRAAGGHNFVSLVELRRAVPVDRATFDAGLHELRRAGRFGMASIEGRQGVTTEQREAAIVEDGTHLLYVLRKTP